MPGTPVDRTARLRERLLGLDPVPRGGPLDRLDRAFHDELFELLGDERYAAWIRSARAVTLDEESFTFHFESTYAKDKVEAATKSAVTQAAQRATNRNVRVRLGVEKDAFLPLRPPALRDSPEPLPRESTFSSFVAGPGNRVALAAARAFARGGPGAPRTLLLFAPSGLGKTHLLRAIAAELGDGSGHLLLQFTGDQFRRHFDYACHRGHLQAFLKKCSAAQALLFDDLHLLSGKLEAQAALAEVLDALHRRRARFALSSEKHPRCLESFSPSLRARVRVELEASLGRPDPVTGAACLRALAPGPVPPGILRYIAEHVRSSHKDQLHCLRELFRRPPVTAQSARAVVGEFLNQWSLGLTYSDIVRAAAEAYGVSVGEIYSCDRSRVASEARHACFYLARKLLGQSFAQIGGHFGGRDHATVLQACRKLERQEGLSRKRLRRLESDLSTPPR
jgi:chromosomal replication initiator protein